MNIKYTIIIPHYNIPILLRRCLASIPIRKDLQVIILDDNSNERSVLLLKELEKEYPNYEFIYTKSNNGAGKLRNIGLGLAKGKYILFADSDDFYNYCINDILNEYSTKEYDIVYFNVNSVDTDTYKNTNRGLYVNNMISVFNKNPKLGELQLKYVISGPWCKIVNHDFLKKYNILFDETNIHNDATFSYLIGHYSKSIKVDNRCAYCITNREGSVSKLISTDRLLTRVEVMTKANLFFRKNNIKRYEFKAIQPLLYFIKKKDLSNIKRCFQIYNLYQTSHYTIIKYLFKHTIHSFIRIFK